MQTKGRGRWSEVAHVDENKIIAVHTYDKWGRSSTYKWRGGESEVARANKEDKRSTNRSELEEYGPTIGESEVVNKKTGLQVANMDRRAQAVYNMGGGGQKQYIQIGGQKQYIQMGGQNQYIKMGGQNQYIQMGGQNQYIQMGGQNQYIQMGGQN